MDLRLYNFDERLKSDDICELLLDEFRDYGPIKIDILRNVTDDERVAYITFKHRHRSQSVQRVFSRLQKIMGKDMNFSLMPLKNDREAKETTEQGKGSHDHDVSTTLFVGNLLADTKKWEIRNIFEKYGKINEIRIRQSQNEDAAYAFVAYQVRAGGPRSSIAYARSKPSNRLCIGRLGPWTSRQVLYEEFEKCGKLDTIEYTEGALQAYIRFVVRKDAETAYRQMKGFPLGGSEHRIVIDYAKDANINDRRREERSVDSPRKRQNLGNQYDSDICTFKELSDQVATTWKGIIKFKKVNYLIQLHRIYGSEDLLQELLRDENGCTIKLRMKKRLPLPKDLTIEPLREASSDQISLMIAVSPQMSLRRLKSYLQQRNIAGFVHVPNAVILILAACPLAECFIQNRAPRVKLLTDDSEYLLFVLAPLDLLDSLL